MRIDDPEFVSFCSLCAQGQTIEPDQAPTKDMVYLNRIDRIPSIAKYFPTISNDLLQDWYLLYLEMKFKFFNLIRNSKPKEEFFTYFAINRSDYTLWDPIFEYWSKQEPKEATVYLLRIRQIDQAMVNNEFYNNLAEFETWAKSVMKNHKLSDKFRDMDSHNEIFPNLDKDNKDNFKKVNNAITEITRKVAANSDRFKKHVLKIFTKLVVELYHCEICDYLYVKDDRIHIYVTSFEPENNRTFESYLVDSEHYEFGAGISGSIMLGRKDDDFYFHTGTNCLSEDWRQSPWHTNAYSEFYQEESLRDFWVFPLYENNKLHAAFRVVNKKKSYGMVDYWTYAERLQLLYLAKWFQSFLSLFGHDTSPQNTNTSKKESFLEVISKDYDLEKELWLKRDTMDTIIKHLTEVIHRRVEKKAIGCCLMVCSSEEADHLCKYGGYEDNVVLECSKENFNKSNADKLTLLNAVSKYYNIVYPRSSIFVWDEDLNFKGVKELNERTTDDGEPSLVLKMITKNYLHSFAFLLERGHHSILVYQAGELKYEYYLSNYNGTWKVRSYQELLNKIKIALNILEVDGIKTQTYENVFEAVWWMSYKKIATMIVIVPHDKIETLTHHSEKDNGTKIDRAFRVLKSTGMIYDVAMIDGAILMDENGMVHYGGLQFNYTGTLSEDLQKAVEKKGTRHHQAARIADNTGAFVFTVSENRYICAFYGTKTILKDE